MGLYIYRRRSQISYWAEEAKLRTNSTEDGVGYSVSVKNNIVVAGDMPYGNKQEGAVFIDE